MSSHEIEADKGSKRALYDMFQREMALNSSRYIWLYRLTFLLFMIMVALLAIEDIHLFQSLNALHQGIIIRNYSPVVSGLLSISCVLVSILGYLLWLFTIGHYTPVKPELELAFGPNKLAEAYVHVVGRKSIVLTLFFIVSPIILQSIGSLIVRLAVGSSNPYGHPTDQVLCQLSVYFLVVSIMSITVWLGVFGLRGDFTRLVVFLAGMAFARYWIYDVLRLAYRFDNIDRTIIWSMVTAASLAIFLNIWGLGRAMIAKNINRLTVAGAGEI